MQQLKALRDVASGLNFLHGLGYVHMDVKPANFLLEGDLDREHLVKGRVSDFGFSVKKGSIFPGGTVLYLPNEVFLQRKEIKEVYFNSGYKVNEKIDSFCLGVTMLEIVSGVVPKSPLGWLSPSELTLEILWYKNYIMATYPKCEALIKLAILDIAKDLLKYNSNERINCNQVVDHLKDLRFK